MSRKVLRFERGYSKLKPKCRGAARSNPAKSGKLDRLEIMRAPADVQVNMGFG